MEFRFSHGPAQFRDAVVRFSQEHPQAAARAALAAALAALLAGCAEFREPVRETREPERDTSALVRQAPAADAAATAAKPPVGTVPRALAHARAPVRALSLRAQCSGRDQAGYGEQIALTVSDGWVGQLEASIDVPKRGSCSFQLAHFRQTKRMPFVELLARREGSRCAVRIWTQGDRVTVAPTDCQEMCVSPRVFESVWPIALSARTGSCL